MTAPEQAVCGFMVNANGDRCIRPFGHAGPCDIDTRKPSPVPRPIRRAATAKIIEGPIATSEELAQVAPSAPVEVVRRRDFKCLECHRAGDPVVAFPTEEALMAHITEAHPDEPCSLTPRIEELERELREDRTEIARLRELINGLAAADHQHDPQAVAIADVSGLLTVAEFEGHLEWTVDRLAEIEKTNSAYDELALRYLTVLVDAVKANGGEMWLLDRIEKRLFFS